MVPPGEVSAEVAGHGRLEAVGVARTDADDLEHLLGVEPRLGAERHRLGDHHLSHLGDHVVAELHGEAEADFAHVEDVGGHRLEIGAAGVDRRRRRRR